MSFKRKSLKPIIRTPDGLFTHIKNAFQSLKEITKVDIESLSKELYSMEEINFDLTYLLQELDSLVKNKISYENFIDALKQKNLVLKSFEEAKKKISTKGENINMVLKELKEEAEKAKDNESISDIEWVIQKLHEGNIYELDKNIMSSEFHANINKEGVDFMIQYSTMENDIQKSKDYSLVRSGLKSDKYVNFNEEKISEGSNKVMKELNSELSEKIKAIISRIDYPDFDIFMLDSITNAQGSLITALEIVYRLDIVRSEIIDLEILNNFINEVIKNYSRTNAYYHNDLHGADVMQTLFTMIIRGNMIVKMKLEEASKFAILIGAICHDLRHPGQNNMFHINTRSKIAIRYNDESVLENFHIASLFKLAKSDKLNIFQYFQPEEYRIIRRRIIEGVLATDMAKHPTVIGAIKNRAESFNIKEGKNFTKMFIETNTNQLFDAQQQVLNMLIHTSDISNPAKPNKISGQWTDRVYEEFFRQGDLEKKLGIEVSMMCDRLTTNVNKQMIGFINFVVLPTIEILFNILPEIPEYLINIKENLKKHQEEYKKDELAKKLKDEKNKNN